jgi:hypothetical protein
MLIVSAWLLLVSLSNTSKFTVPALPTQEECKRLAGVIAGGKPFSCTQYTIYVVGGGSGGTTNYLVAQ